MASRDEPGQPEEEALSNKAEEASGLPRGSAIPTNSSDEEDINLEKTLESIRPYPKAAPRAPSRRGRKRRSSAILIDPQTMEELSNEQKATKQRKQKVAKTAPKKRGRPRKNKTN